MHCEHLTQHSQSSLCSFVNLYLSFSWIVNNIFKSCNYRRGLLFGVVCFFSSTRIAARSVLGNQRPLIFLAYALCFPSLIFLNLDRAYSVRGSIANENSEWKTTIIPVVIFSNVFLIYTNLSFRFCASVCIAWCGCT